MRLIDADAFYENVAEWEAQALHMVEMTMHDEDNAEWKRWSTILTERSAFKFNVADAPTIDAIPVVRCRDCQNRYEYLFCGYMGDNDFCSAGQPRKDGADNGC